MDQLEPLGRRRGSKAVVWSDGSEGLLTDTYLGRTEGTKKIISNCGMSKSLITVNKYIIRVRVISYPDNTHKHTLFHHHLFRETVVDNPTFWTSFLCPRIWVAVFKLRTARGSDGR